MMAPTDDQRNEAPPDESAAGFRARLGAWLGDEPFGQTPYSGRWLLWLVLVTVLMAAGLVILLLAAIF